jgi:hypothetical protein
MFGEPGLQGRRAFAEVQDELLVGRIQARLVAIGAGDGALRRTDLTGTAVDDRHRRPGVVDEPDGQDARLLGGTG